MTRPQIYAHRGFSHRFPENTLLAFEQAALAGADGVEFDIHLAADGVPVVVHDLPLGRTVKGTGLVPSWRSDQLAAMDAGDRATAERIAQVTGGHPGLVRTAAGLGLALEHVALEQALSRTPDVLGILKHRMDDDDRQKRPPRRHASFVLRALLDGRPVKTLEDLGSDLDLPEVRLFYDGMLRSDEQGRTLFRCAAVRRAAALVLSQWDEVQV